MTEAEARAALAAFDGRGGVECWIVDQPWGAVPGGWQVQEQLQGYRFRVEPAADGVRVVMYARAGAPVWWTVPA